MQKRFMHFRYNAIRSLQTVQVKLIRHQAVMTIRRGQQAGFILRQRIIIIKMNVQQSRSNISAGHIAGTTWKWVQPACMPT